MANSWPGLTSTSENRCMIHGCNPLCKRKLKSRERSGWDGRGIKYAVVGFNLLAAFNPSDNLSLSHLRRSSSEFWGWRKQNERYETTMRETWNKVGNPTINLPSLGMVEIQPIKMGDDLGMLWPATGTVEPGGRSSTQGNHHFQHFQTCIYIYIYLYIHTHTHIYIYINDIEVYCFQAGEHLATWRFQRQGVPRKTLLQTINLLLQKGRIDQQISIKSTKWIQMTIAKKNAGHGRTWWSQNEISPKWNKTKSNSYFSEPSLYIPKIHFVPRRVEALHATGFRAETAKWLSMGLNFCPFLAIKLINLQSFWS